MRDLKTTTNDDTILIHYKDYGRKKAKIQKWATKLEMIVPQPKITSQTIVPTNEELSSLSPSKNNSRKDEWICTICGVKGKSHEDCEFNPPSAFHDWIGCDNGTLGDGEECNIWMGKWSDIGGVYMVKEEWERVVIAIGWV